MLLNSEYRPIVFGVMKLRVGGVYVVVGLFAANGQAATFSIAVLPDTQYYARNSVNSLTNVANVNDPDNFFRTQTQWIVNNASAKGIVFATHLGDIVNNSHFPTGSSSGSANGQWVIATNAMATLQQSSVPHSILPGNHDWSSTSGTGAANHYLSRFGGGSNYFAGKTWFAGYDARGMNSAQLFDTPAGKMLHLALEYEAGDLPAAIAGVTGAAANPLNWAQSVIDANPGVPTIISTHNNINTSGDRDDSGTAIYNHLAYNNSQVFMVLNGHYASGTTSERRITTTNSRGQPVYEMLSDYQARERGGDGWMRLMEFDTTSKQVVVRTFTPVAAGVSTVSGGVGATVASPADLPGASLEEVDSDSRFVLPLDFENRFQAPVVGGQALQKKVFRQGLGGYAGTHDTYITSQPASNGLAAPNGANPDGSNTGLDSTDYRQANWGSLPTLFVDAANFVDGTGGVVGGTSGGFHRFQSLIRFDGIFGGGATQVGSGTTITSATLTLFIGGPSDQPGGGTDPGSGFRLVRLTRAFTESSNWASMENGIELGVDALAALEAPVAAAGSATPLPWGVTGISSSANGLVTQVNIDVTAALRAWQADPASNFGWALLETVGGTNGTRLWSSEAAMELNRPTLTVFAVSVVPEPGSSVALLAAAGLGVMGRRRR